MNGNMPHTPKPVESTCRVRDDHDVTRDRNSLARSHALLTSVCFVCAAQYLALSHIAHTHTFSLPPSLPDSLPP